MMSPYFEGDGKEVGASTATKFFSVIEMANLDYNVDESLRWANRRLGSTPA